MRSSYGSVMADVARRFELVGRAVRGGRFELGEYEVGEIGELFEVAIPQATPPKDGHPEVLPRMARSFLQRTIPDLRAAMKANDRTTATAAFERTAVACNGCHRASGHGFIEISGSPGHAVPNTDPVAP